MSDEGTIGNTIKSEIADITSEFSGQGGGALSGTFFAADQEKTPYSTFAHGINELAREANFPLGKPVKGAEVADVTYNNQPINDPSGIFKSGEGFGTLDSIVASTQPVEFSADGSIAMKTFDTTQPAANADVSIQTLAV